MECLQGKDPPTQRAGYWAGKLDAEWRIYSVISCRNRLECPAGPAETCAVGRQGIGCGNCKNWHYRSEKGRCDPCRGSADTWPLVLAILAICAALAGSYMYASADPTKQPLTTATVALSLGQLAAAVQALGAFRQLQIDWIEPVASALDLLALLTFDLHVIKAECTLGQDDPVTNYVLRLLVYPCFACVLAFALLALRTLGRAAIDTDRILNSQGLIVLIAYISLALSVALPFQCIPNPNGTSSLASNPAAICWEWDSEEGSPHQALVGLGLAGVLCYPVTILSVVFYITLRQPALIASGKGLMLVRRFRWLFNRFRPDILEVLLLG